MKIEKFQLFLQTSLSIFMLTICFTCSCQWIDSHLDIDSYLSKLDEIEINKENKEHYASSGGTICTCDLLYKNTDTTSYTVQYFFKKYEDVAFFIVSFKSGKSITGYFKKVKLLCDDDEIYCWVQDLVWYYFDENSHIEKVEIYSDGAKYQTLLED